MRVLVSVNDLRMANGTNKGANSSLEVLFDKSALLYDDDLPMEQSLSEASKTPTKPLQADLAATVEGDDGELGPNSTPIQGPHVSSTVAQGSLRKRKTFPWVTGLQREAGEL